MRRIREQLSFANVVACLALFIALGGASYAAVNVPKNSVGSPQIKKNAVKTGDIARNAVRTGKLASEAAKAGKIAKGAIVTNRLRDNAVTGAKVNESTLGAVPNAAKATNATNAANAANAANADLLDGLDASAFLGKEQLHVSNGPVSISEDFPLIAFPDVGFELRTNGSNLVGYVATAPGNYEWSGYLNGARIFSAIGPSEVIVASVPLEDTETAEINRLAMVRQGPDLSDIGVATADCFNVPSNSGEIACLGHSASSD